MSQALSILLAHLRFGGLGHDIAGGGGKSGALELNGGVRDAELRCGFLLDGGQYALAFVQVHVRNAGMKTESIMIAAEAPDMEIVDFVNAFDG